MKKRWFGFFMALVMLLSVLPAAVWADPASGTDLGGGGDPARAVLPPLS